MKIGVNVGDIMTRDFITVNPDTSLQNCAKLMIKKRVGSLIITEKKKLKGLVTERDIIWAMTKKSVSELSKIKVKDIAKKKLATVKPSSDLYEALQKMKKSKYRWLPVMVKGGIVGFLTIKGILRVEPSLFEIAHSQGVFQIKEEEEKLVRSARRKGGSGRGYSEGVCEGCGNFDLLYNLDSRLICESCKDEM